MNGKYWPAYILHSRPYQEDKLLLQLLLPEQGRLSAVIRRRQGKHHRALQPFQLCQLTLAGRSSLQTVAQIEELAPAMLFRGRVLYSGLYMNELICRIWPNDLASDSLFTYYQSALQKLQDVHEVPEKLEPCLRQFEFQLLAELGVLPDWCFDATQQEIRADRCYQYVVDQGFVCVGAGWSGAALLAIAAENWQCSGALALAKQVSRQLLKPLLGDKPLISRTLFSHCVGEG